MALAKYSRGKIQIPLGYGFYVSMGLQSIAYLLQLIMKKISRVTHLENQTGKFCKC